jgi:hypothetical protein
METQTAPGYPTATNPNMASPAAAHEKKGMAEKVKGLLGGLGHKQSPEASPHQQSGGGGVYGDATPTTGNAESTKVGCLDKIKSKAGIGHGEQQHHNQGAVTDPSASPDFNGGTNINSSAAVHGGWPHPTNPRDQSASPPNPNQAMADPQPTNPTGVTNAQGGAVLDDQHGNVQEGPRDDHVKKEGIVSKIMDKLHSPKGKPAQTTATTTPASY